ncbi:hypothetical protein REPUB_Repub05bG0063400 [Reevesia pubescens]
MERVESSNGNLAHGHEGTLLPAILLGNISFSWLDLRVFYVIMYDEFCPILLNQFKSREYVNFETFVAAFDEFYSKIESQRAEIVKDQGELCHSEIKQDSLGSERSCVRMTELIYSLEDVDDAILVVRVALTKGMNWEDLAPKVKEKNKCGNPMAGLIDQLHLERSCMTLLLSNNFDEMDDDEMKRHSHWIRCYFSLSLGSPWHCPIPIHLYL